MACDTLDMRILELLSEDSRRGAEELSRLLGTDPAEISRRIQKLEDDHVLVRYSALVDWEKTGHETVQALIEVRVAPQQDMGFDSIAARIYRFDEVKTVYLMSGGFDLMVILEAISLKQLAYFVAEKLSVLENVQSCATHFVLRKYKVDGVVLADAASDRRLAVSP